MKTLKVNIVFELTGDETDEDTLRTDIYDKLQELMDTEELDFRVSSSEDDEDA